MLTPGLVPVKVAIQASWALPWLEAPDPASEPDREVAVPPRGRAGLVRGARRERGAEAVTRASAEPVVVSFTVFP